MSAHAWHIMREKISVGPDTNAREVTMKIISSGLAAMPVVDDNRELLGVVSENAILDAIRDERDLDSIPASTIMVPAPIITDADTPTKELIGLLLKSCCSIVVVVKENKYVGVISRHMLMDIFTSPHFSRFSAKDRKSPFACK
jgi:predicted transcriptional regulator